MDDTISHDVETRLAAIEARLDALEGGPVTAEAEDVEDDEEEEV